MKSLKKCFTNKLKAGWQWGSLEQNIVFTSLFTFLSLICGGEAELQRFSDLEHIQLLKLLLKCRFLNSISIILIQTVQGGTEQCTFNKHSQMMGFLVGIWGAGESNPGPHGCKYSTMSYSMTLRQEVTYAPGSEKPQLKTVLPKVRSVDKYQSKKAF